MVNFCVLSTISIGIGVGGILVVSLVYALTGGTTPLDYGVVVDAGSTHTQITLYKWLGDKDRGTGRVLQEFTCKVQGGLHKNKDPDEAVQSLTGCLSNVTNAFPHEETSTTSIFLGATAGFRLLNESNPGLSHDILTGVNQSFSKLGYNPEQVRILSGQEEGLYAWITSNFLTNALMTPPQVNTIGAMDLGGASTQIAFSTPEQQNNSVHLRLFGNDHFVTSQSSMCFGVEEAYRRHLAELAKNVSGPEFNISEPCAPLNYNFERSHLDLFNQTCTLGLNSTWYTAESYEAKNYTFQGTGDAQLCWDRVAFLLNRTKCMEQYSEDHCFHPVIAPAQNYYAVSSFFYTAFFLNKTTASLNEFHNASWNLCGKSWEEVETMPSSSNETLPRFCFQAVFMEQILTDMYLFNEKTWESIMFIKKLNKTDVGWALGYMIDTTNAIPAESPTEPSISLVAMIIVLVLCVALLVVGAYFIWRKKKFPSEVSYIQV